MKKNKNPCELLAGMQNAVAAWEKNVKNRLVHEDNNEL